MFSWIKAQFANAFTTMRPPVYSGKHTWIGAEGPIHITRDSQGVPHISASDTLDCIRAQGFVHAQERLWQMEVLRRMANGTMSEIIPEFLLVDRICRTLGFTRIGKQDLGSARANGYWEEMLVLNAYVDGINSYINSPMYRIPAEFVYLDIKPEDWAVYECAGVHRLLVWQLSNDWLLKMVDFLLNTRLYKGNKSEDTQTNTIAEQLAAIIDWSEVKKLSDAFPSLKNIGSAYAVSGKYTAGSRPLLAADPLASSLLPSLWFQNHLQCNEFEISGASLIGVPFVLIGHNASGVSWGASLSFIDESDLYLERFPASNPMDYFFKDTERECEVHSELITVKGCEEVFVENVRITHHGPVLPADFFPMEFTAEDGVTQCRYSVSVSSVCLKPINGLVWSGLRYIARSRNWTQFTAAVRTLDCVPFTFVYADSENNIGYHTAGSVPERTEAIIKAKRTQALLDGWTGQHEYESGYISKERLPHCLNPEQGYVICSNQNLAASDSKVYLGDSFFSSERAQRIEEILLDFIRCKTKIAIGDLMSIQSSEALIQNATPSNRSRNPTNRSKAAESSSSSDNASEKSAKIITGHKKLLKLLKTCQLDAVVSPATVKRTKTVRIVQEATQILRSWNGDTSTKSVGAALFQYFCAALNYVLLVSIAHVTPTTARHIAGSGQLAIHRRLQPDALTEALTQLIDTDAIDAVGGLRALFSTALTIAVKSVHRIHKRFATDVEPLTDIERGLEIGAFQLGNVQHIQFSHLLADEMSSISLNRGPFAIGGSAYCPHSVVSSGNSNIKTNGRLLALALSADSLDSEVQPTDKTESATIRLSADEDAAAEGHDSVAADTDDDDAHSDTDDADAINHHHQNIISGDDVSNGIIDHSSQAASSCAYRILIDLSNLSNAKYLVVPGQSGNIGSPHYDDGIELMKTGRYWSALWNANEVYADRVGTLSFTVL